MKLSSTVDYQTCASWGGGFQRLACRISDWTRSIRRETTPRIMQMQNRPDPRVSSPFHRIGLGGILAISAALRVIIAQRGGEFYWTDEGRFGRSRLAVGDFMAGHFRDGLDTLLQSADHLLFKFAGLLPAWVERYCGSVQWIPAVFFGGFSVILIYLVWRLVLEQGGSPLEALLAALLMSECDAFFYYARHVFPYDLSLCLFLGSAICSYRPGLRNSFLTGMLSGIGFLCYNGYWLFGGAMLTVATLARWRAARDMLTFAVVALVGLVAPTAVAFIVGRLLGHDLFKSLIEFSGHSSGDVGHAWRFVGEYFWASEHYLAVFWLVAFLSAATLWVAGRVEKRVVWWMSGAALFYASIVGYSDILRRYALFARHVRPLAIFFCLIGAWFLAKLFRTGSWGKAACYLILAGTLMQAGWNMSTPMNQEFPLEFKKRAESVILKDMEQNLGLYQVWTDGYYENARAMESRPHRVLARSPHPIQFIPYTLDGWNEALRAAFRTQDLSMRVVCLLPEKPDGRPQIARTGGAWSPYLGAVRLEVIFDPGPGSYAQPIISCGRTGAGDEVYVEFVDSHTIRLGVDQWGIGAVHSQPIPCDLLQPHVITISLGSLYPDESSRLFQENPQWRPLKDTVLVKFDGVVAIGLRRGSYAALPGSVEVFHNLFGFSTAGRAFEGRVLSMSWVTPRDLLPDVEKLH